MAADLETRHFARLTGDLSGTDDSRPPLVLMHGLTFDRTTWRPVARRVPQVRSGSCRAQPRPPRTRRQCRCPRGRSSGRGRSWSATPSTPPAYNIPSSSATPPAAWPPPSTGPDGRAVAWSTSTSHWRSATSQDSCTISLRSFAARGLQNSGRPLPRACTQSCCRRPDRPSSAAASNPRQDVVLAYWAEVLDQTPEELAALLNVTVRALRAANVPFTMIAGSDPDPEYRSWLATTLPHATISVWPGTGHFPHIAHPQAFARVLAETATWPKSSDSFTHPADR